jgi:hypothetical protein
MCFSVVVTHKGGPFNMNLPTPKNDFGVKTTVATRLDLLIVYQTFVGHMVGAFPMLG